MKGLILAGGHGTRLRPLSHTGPKQLVPVANKPVLYYCIEDLRNAGIKEIGIIVGYTEERINAIKDSCGDGSKWGVKITYIEQDAPRGLAHAVGITEDFMGGEDFVVYLGDNLLKEGIKDIVENFKKSDADASLLLSWHKNPKIFGVALLDKNGEIIDVEEKPEKPKSNYVITGIYIFKPNIFDFIKKVKPGKRGELQLTDAIKMMVKSKDYKVISKITNGWWDDTGNADDILRANHLVLMDLKDDIKGKISKSAKLFGNLNVGHGTIIKEGCVLKGPIIIGKNCVIGPNSYIGPYTSIGDNVEVLNGDIESSIILDNAKIHVKHKIVDSLIGKDAVVKMKEDLPKGTKLILGEHSEVYL